jgi:hypothetical protein
LDFAAAPPMLAGAGVYRTDANAKNR